MDPLQEQHERFNGDQLIDWLNQRLGSGYRFLRRAGQAPDLVYSFSGSEISIEVTTAYYDGPHAKWLWAGARSSEEIDEPWIGMNADKALACEVVNRIAAKCVNNYGENCILLVVVPPGVTSAEKLAEVLAGESISCASFVGVYVAGRFPITSSSSGGYRVITVKEWHQMYARERSGL